MDLTRLTASSAEEDIRPFASAVGRSFDRRCDRPERDGEGDDGSPSPDEATLDAFRTDNMHLRALLATLPIIEQAKGILIARYQIDADTAFSLLRRWSSHANVKVRDIARMLVDTAGQSRVQPLDVSDRLPADLLRLIESLATVQDTRVAEPPNRRPRPEGAQARAGLV